MGHEQEEVIGFLSAADSYGQSQGLVERCETHGAVVFLSGHRAYKLKRAIKYPYMDYSTPERRRDMCLRELAINRRTAPELYLEVRSIVRGESGTLKFGGLEEKSAVDWVVVMRRFEQSALLEQLRRRGELTTDLMRPLAESITQLHQTADVHREFGGAEGITEVIAECIDVLKSMRQDPFDGSLVERFESLAWSALERVRGILDGRRTKGFVRRCHGDLHLNNICLLGGRPVLFDAIEFNDSFACIDVLFDLAFLLMDLDRHHLRAHANALFNRYLELNGEFSGLAALPLFLACRAAIRAHVAAATEKVSASNGAGKADEARGLLRQSLAYLVASQPRIVAVGGVSGTGKTTLSRNLAVAIDPAPGAVVLRSDVFRKQLMGVGETVRLPASAYKPEINAEVYRRIFHAASQAVASGHSVVTDAVYGDRLEQEGIEAVAARAGVPFDGIWLEAPLHLLDERIIARRHDASDATVKVLRQQLDHVRMPDRWHAIDAARTEVEVARDVAGYLGIPVD